MGKLNRQIDLVYFLSMWRSPGRHVSPSHGEKQA